MSDASNSEPPRVDHTPQPPKQVRDQIAAAEQMRTEMESAAGGTSTPPPDPGAPPPPAPPPSSESPGQPAGDGGEDSWEQRARSMAGRLEQANRTNQALSDRMQQLETTLATMQLRGPQASEPAPVARPKLVTDQEAQEYGDEFLTVVGKRAKEEYAPEFEMLAQRLQRLEGRVDGVGTVIEKTQTNDVYGTLAGSVPNWREINRSEIFKEWLKYPDPYSGRKRHDMLMEAFTGHDAGRVVRFFQGFLTEAAGLPPNSPGPGPSAPPLAPPSNGQGNGSGKPSLEDFAAPGRARSAPHDVPPDKPIYTSAWIAKFTQDKLRGVYRGREAEADLIERDIYAAQHEGRIH